MGGGFLYTNKDSVSLGLVCGLGDIAHAQKSVPQMLEDFKQHPAIRPLISGGKLLEYSAHMVPEGGLAMVPQLVNDGVMIVGDAAGFLPEFGFYSSRHGFSHCISSGCRHNGDRRQRTRGFLRQQSGAIQT